MDKKYPEHSAEISNPSSGNLYNLAEKLVQNYIQLSFPPELWAIARKYILKRDVVAPAAPQAVVVVIGAGASADTIGLPVGKETISHLKQSLQIPAKFFEPELKRLSMQYRLEPGEFETELLAMSKFSGSNLLDELESIFLRRFYVSPIYEILAHLLKHRFIDAIINFNFDEILDQALDDELGQENYYRIVSDGELPDDISKLEDENQRFAIPLYVKPHGTASSKSSLRFTREAYFLLPENLSRLLLGLLSNTPTTLVLIGFGMQSVEFNGIINNAAQKNPLEIFIIDEKAEVTNRVPKDVKKTIHIPTQKNSSRKLLLELWKTIGEFFQDNCRPRGIERHHFISTLFSEEKLNYRESERNRHPIVKHYLKDRTIIEIALAIAKARGFVNTTQLATSRPGRYFEHYREHAKAATETLNSLCEKLKLQQVGYSPDTLRLSEKESENSYTADKLIIDSQSWGICKDELIEATLAQLSPARQTLARKPENIKLLKNTVDYMYRSDELEVYCPKKPPYQHIFQETLQFGSLTATKVFTKQMLQENWDTMLAIAESGEWLYYDDAIVDDIVKQIKKHRTGLLKLIIADGVYEKELKEKYKGLDVNIEVERMPWWLHNQHMTLTIRNGRPVSGIYFERRLRALAITPVGLRGQGDLEIALNTFLAYSIKAERFKENEKSMFITMKDVDAARAKLFSHHY